MPYLKAAADENGVGLNLGVGKGVSFIRGRIPSGKIDGIVHVDLYRFIRSVFSQYLQSETLSLNEVAGELVGAKKEDFDFGRLANMKDSDWLDFFSYSLQDAVVTHELALKLWPDMQEFCRIFKKEKFHSGGYFQQMLKMLFFGGRGTLHQSFNHLIYRRYFNRRTKCVPNERMNRHWHVEYTCPRRYSTILMHVRGLQGRHRGVHHANACCNL